MDYRGLKFRLQIIVLMEFRFVTTPSGIRILGWESVMYGPARDGPGRPSSYVRHWVLDEMGQPGLARDGPVAFVAFAFRYIKRS